MKCFGWGYIGTAYTVQDLDFDPSGTYIYAEAHLTVNRLNPASGQGKSTVHYLNNRAYSIVNGVKKYVPPFYKQGDEKACLVNLIAKMHTIGQG